MDEVVELKPKHMYESYIWGSGELMNLCAVDTFLETFFQIFKSHIEVFNSSSSAAMLTLKESYEI